KDERGRLWNVRLAALANAATNPSPDTLVFVRFDAETRTNLTRRLASQPVRVAHTLMNSSGTGIGFIYVDGQPLHRGLVAEGRLPWISDDARALPVPEQREMRGVARRAQKERVGLWALNDSDQRVQATANDRESF